ncbi:MAG: C25 family cysteine peptidase [Acidobacteriota bacterium]
MHCECRHHSHPDRDAVRVTVSFDTQDLAIRRTPFGLVIDLASARSSGPVGGPAFPRRVFKVAVPSTQWPTGLSVENEHWVPVTQEPALIAPAQPLRPGINDAAGSTLGNDTSHHIEASCRRARPNGPSEFPDPFQAPSVVPPDTDLYEKELRAPRPLARALGIEQAGLTRIARIEINPVRFNPAGLLEFCTRFDVVLTTGDTMPLDDKQAAHKALQQRLGREIDPARMAPLPDPVINSATHARRVTNIARSEVVNPDLVSDISHRWPAYELASEYLIVTDDRAWNETTITPGAAIPGIVAAFDKLAAWKRSRGISTRVVTITDIVGGRYGNFRDGARDLQELLRRFLKNAVPRWGVSWLLIGGDIGVVPIRRVAGALEGGIGVAAVDPPADNTSFWTGSFLKVHVVNPGTWWPGSSSMNVLVNPATGARIPYDGAGTSSASSPGWYFTTSDSYATRTATATNFVRVNGPSGIVNASLQWLYQWNTLPTDLYYASLTSYVIAYLSFSLPFGSSFSIPYVYFPEHDWDALGNGLYGQYNGSGDLDGVVLAADVSVGRAPVDSAAQAEAFVAKVVAYESFRSPATGFSLDGNWPRRVLLASSDWGGPSFIASTTAFPPGDAQYYHAAGSRHALIKLAATPGGFEWEVIAEISDADRRVIPYSQDATEGGRGWHFATSPTDLRPNGISIPLPPLFGGPFFFPLPSPWIVVYGSLAEVSPADFLIDWPGQDSSMSDQEELRAQLRTEIPGWDTVSRLYEDELDLTPAQAVAAPVQHLGSDRLRAALNAAPHIVSLSGHGNSDGCCSGSVWMASGLTNGYQSFIGYADSCLTNQVDASDAFSEALVCDANGGAVAYVGNTRFSWIGVGDNFQRAFFHRLTAVRQLGLLNDSRLGLVGGTGYNTVYERWAIFALNLIGDPEMQVYKGRVRQFRITVSDRIRREPVVIHVVEQQPPTPIPHPEPSEHVLVYIRQGDTVFTARTDANGDARFDLSGLARGSVQITASHDEFAACQLDAVITGPDWVRGRVVEIAHRDGGPRQSVVRLDIDGAERRFIASADHPDYRLILDALENAFVAREAIDLRVDSVDDGGAIERFRFSGGQRVPDES